MSPAQYVSVSLATCVGLCRFGEAWAALRAENLLTYLLPCTCIAAVKNAISHIMLACALATSTGVVRPITGPWPTAFPAKELCSNCGLCKSSVGVESVTEACAFIGDGMSRAEQLEPMVHGRGLAPAGASGPARGGEDVPRGPAHASGASHLDLAKGEQGDAAAHPRLDGRGGGASSGAPVKARSIGCCCCLIWLFRQNQLRVHVWWSRSYVKMLTHSSQVL